MTRHSLVLRMLLCHVTAASAVGMAWAWGWLDQLIATDTLYLVRVNCALGVMGICVATARAVWLGREMDQAYGTKLYDYQTIRQTFGPDPVAFEGLRIALSSRIGDVAAWAYVIQMFGLIGTFVGLIMAFAAIDISQMSDPTAAVAVILDFCKGAGIALYKSAAGAVFSVYLYVMHRMLAKGGAHVLSIAARAA